MLKVKQNYAIPKRVKESSFGGLNGLMPKQIIHTESTQQFIPATILASLIHYAEQQEWDYKKWFEDSGLDLDQVQQSNGFVRFSQMCDVIRKAITAYDQPDLGLKMGRSEGLISMGILGFAMQSCKTVADALEIALEFHRVSGSVLNIEFSILDDICTLEVTEPSPTFDLKAFFYDELFSSVIACLNAILGDHDDVIGLELNYDPTANLEDYQYLFGCPVQLNTTSNKIHFKSSMLNRNLKNYSPANYATAIQICKQALKEIDQLNQVDFVHIVEHLIEQYLPERFEMRQAADHLQMSERHLRRKLLSEGLSFQQIRQNALERKAKQLLEKNLSMSEISLQLGFSELREFRRAFKRWTGQAPSVYKQETHLT